MANATLVIVRSVLIDKGALAGIKRVIPRAVMKVSSRYMLIASSRNTAKSGSFIEWQTVVCMYWIFCRV